MPIASLAGLSLRDLEYAVAVAELRHFGQAASRCGVSQSALSEQIRKLEALLGIVLFERTRRRVELTPRGAVLLRQAEELLAAARNFIETARHSARPLTGELRLGVIPTLGPYYLPSLLHDARAAFPELMFRLEEGQTQKLVDALRRGELDMVLAALPLAVEGVVTEPLFFEPFRLACPTGHRLATAPDLQLADLQGDDLLLMAEGHCLRDQALSVCGVQRLDRHTRYASSLEMLRYMIGAGEGYSLLPLLAVRGREQLDASIVYRDLSDDRTGRMVGLAWRAAAPRAEDLRQVANYLREQVPEGLSSQK